MLLFLLSPSSPQMIIFYKCSQGQTKPTTDQHNCINANSWQKKIHAHNSFWLKTHQYTRYAHKCMHTSNQLYAIEWELTKSCKKRATYVYDAQFFTDKLFYSLQSLSNNRWVGKKAMCFHYILINIQRV